MLHYLDYQVEEVRVTTPNGENFYVYGTLTIAYTIQRAEPDIGIMGDWPAWDCEKAQCWLEGLEDEGKLDISLTPEMLQQILGSERDRIEQAIMDEWSYSYD